MQRHLIIASHDRLALGFKQTIEFISGKQNNLHILTAYTDNKPIESKVSEIMNEIDPKNEVIILTDMLAGSVNQKFFLYKNRPHTYRYWNEFALSTCVCDGIKRWLPF